MRGAGGRPGDGPRHVGVGPLDVVVLAAEIAVYVGVWVLARRADPPVAGLAVVLMAVWWGLLHSPKARWRLPRPADLALRCLWFGIGAVCLLTALLT